MRHVSRAILASRKFSTEYTNNYGLIRSLRLRPFSSLRTFPWLGREATPLAQRDCVRNPRAVSAPPVAMAADATPVQPSPVVAGDATAPPLVVQPGWERGLDLAVMQERYPLLRNTL